MLTQVKRGVENSRYAPAVSGPYRALVKRPYWFLRRNVFHYPVSRTVAGVTARFAVEHEQDLRYHEFESERPILTDLFEQLEDGDVFYDVGANIGLYSCLVANTDSAVSVVAIEPSPPASEKLARNLELNGGARSFPVVATDRDGPIEFAVDVGDVQARQSKVAGSTDEPRYDVIDRQGVRLDTLQAEENLPEPSVMKIELEGGEMDVLGGMERLLDAVEVLYCEVHHSEFDGTETSGEDVLDALESSGFEIESLDERGGGNEFIKAIRPERR